MAKGKICRIPGCKNILKIQDGQVCGAHRLRFMRHGNYDISPNWTVLEKGKPHLTNWGYFRVWVNGKRILQHVHVMEQYLGRKLENGERVHHINGIKTDNRIENLRLFTNQSEHIHICHPEIWKTRTIRNPNK